MTKQLPEELARARELMDQAKLDEALEFIEQYEKSESLSPKDQLSALLIKGRAYLYKQRTRKALQAFEVAYQMSQDLGLVPESVSALIGKAYIGFIGDLDKAFTYVLNAERNLNSLDDDPSTGMLRRNLLLIKSWILFFQGKNKKATESAEKYLRLTEEEQLGNKLDLALIFLLLGYINMELSNRTQALDFAMKSLELNQELKRADAIADVYSLMGRIYYSEGDYDQALEYDKQTLSIKEISNRTKSDALGHSAHIYALKGKYNRAIKYKQQAIALAEKMHLKDQVIRFLNDLGYFYRIIGKFNLAEESHKRALMLAEEWLDHSLRDKVNSLVRSLGFLIFLYVDEGSREKANQYFSRLSELYDQTKDNEDIDFTISYLHIKAYMMKSSTRISIRMEALTLYKELLNPNLGPLDLIRTVGCLCDLLLEDLSLSNEPEILDEINPLISRMLEMAGNMRNYHWLAETKLLQAKLALIQTDIEEARRLMVEAQRIADLHGLNLLARGISSEHDKLLEQIEVWNKFKKEEAPLGERVRLASTEGVLERMQGKRAVEPPEPVDEQSILLMIIAEGGVLIFSYPFSEEWKFDNELFGGFLTAFNSISDEIFSEGLDRVKFGKQTVLMEQVANFSICYLFKGQTYIAQQKLTKFVKEMQKNTSLWQNLEQHYKTNQILELKRSPQLESLITEIFTSTN